LDQLGPVTVPNTGRIVIQRPRRDVLRQTDATPLRHQRRPPAITLHDDLQTCVARISEVAYGLGCSRLLIAPCDDQVVMLSIVYRLVRSLLGAVAVLLRREVSKDAELLVLLCVPKMSSVHVSRAKSHAGRGPRSGMITAATRRSTPTATT
jgi:hypothetical protein